MAASKMEALKRYMGGGAPEEKLKKKRKKKKTDTGLGMYVVDDDDDAWNDGLSKQGKGKDLWQDERTEYDEEQPTVVGDGAEDYDPESQPIVANAEEFFERERTEELEKQWLAAETKPSIDASPPRKARHQDASPPRKSRQQDASSPPRKSRRQDVKDLQKRRLLPDKRRICLRHERSVMKTTRPRDGARK
ncbi:hypothetical protein AaE_003604 [Aphanomyces astaci]|uniref:Uncharacterized protein n=1 Tax=Aphanomyces astaci TaxID=112090 RepID=A0A6A5ALE1_APHAT|nr:hypothetical protein AaE_003604 [Aphanomyces astaci]